MPIVITEFLQYFHRKCNKDRRNFRADITHVLSFSKLWVLLSIVSLSTLLLAGLFSPVTRKIYNYKCVFFKQKVALIIML